MPMRQKFRTQRKSRDVWISDESDLWGVARRNDADVSGCPSPRLSPRFPFLIKVCWRKVPNCGSVPVRIQYGKLFWGPVEKLCALVRQNFRNSEAVGNKNDTVLSRPFSARLASIGFGTD